MGLFENFPYTNFHELNLDWIVQSMKNVSNDVEQINATIAETAQKEIEKLYEKGLLTTPYNIVSHGADPSGKVESSGIIQSVLNTFGICYIPNGIYKISKPITIDTGMVVLGESPTNAVLSCTSDCFVTKNFASHTGTGDDEAPYGFTIENVRITGNDKNTGIKIYGYHYFIMRCMIEHFETGIYSEYNKNTGFSPSGGTMESYIDRCLIQKLSGSVANICGPSDCFITNTCFSNAKNGIKVYITGTSWATGANIQMCHGYTISNGGAGACYDINCGSNIYNCTGESSDVGIAIHDNTGVNVQGGAYYNNTKYGVVLDASSSIIVNGAFLRLNKTAEINLAKAVNASYINCVVIGDSKKITDGAGVINRGTTTFIVWNNMNGHIINKPKVMPKITATVSSIKPGAAVVPSQNYGVLVYQKGGTGIYVNDGFTADPIGDVETFFVPAGCNWSCATVPKTVVYQPLLF